MNVYRVYSNSEFSDLVVANTFSEAEGAITAVKSSAYQIKKIEFIGTAIVVDGEKK